MQIPKTHPTIQTARLTVRMPSERDASAIARYYRENAKHLAPTSPPRSADFTTENHWLSKIPEYRADFEQDQAIRLFLFDRTDDRNVLGSVGFTNFIRGPLQACNLGYALSKSGQGHGLMFEALQPAIRYVFDELKLHRIMAGHLPENERSARLLNRLGFVIEGRAKDYLFINGSWQDHILTSLVNLE
jgi:ribosomal-protein-alanine N-acetyltransferase